MAWIHLCIAGLLEILWAISLKHTAGFSNLRWSILTVVGMIASFYFLAQSLRTIPVGTAYAIWTGIGATGAFVVGIIVLGESANPMRILAAILILSGLVMMKMSS